MFTRNRHRLLQHLDRPARLRLLRRRTSNRVRPPSSALPLSLPFLLALFAKTHLEPFFFFPSSSVPPSTSERTSGLASPPRRESSRWERSSTEEFLTTLLTRRSWTRFSTTLSTTSLDMPSRRPTPTWSVSEQTGRNETNAREREN